MKGLPISILILVIVSVTSHTYNCVFDHQNKDLTPFAQNNVPQVAVAEPGRYLHGRLLSTTNTSSYANMRIYIESSQFSSSTITPGVNGATTTTSARLAFILNSLLVTKSFYEKRLKAGQLTTITIPAYCVDFAPSNANSTINNYELVLFAQYLTDTAQGYGATGKSCDWVSGTRPDLTLQVGRPTVGRIIFNTYNLVDRQSSLTNRLFQSLTTTTIHQVTHILGFDATLYYSFLDPTTGDYYSSAAKLQNSSTINSQRPATSLLTTPYVKAWAQKHYNCSTLLGMPLENQDATGSTAGSHWQRTAIYDELMTATSFGASKGMFGVTFALLKDTGWYLVDDSFSQTTNYGYNKGCSFVLDACYSNTQSFTQFCNPTTLTNVSLCQTTFYGKSICSSDSSIMSDSCGVYFPYFNCVDPASLDSGYQSYTYEAYSTNSFCIMSTFGTITMPSTLESRCYPFTCSGDSIVFTVGSYSVTCLSTEQGVSKTLSALKGSLTCPNFQQFCTVSRKTCSNWCSQHGYCMNGVCNCDTGYYGSDCSITNCTSSQFYSSSSSTCVTTCPTGTYSNQYSKTCQICQSPCETCSGTATSCLSCINTGTLKYFYLGYCYSSCPSATFISGFACVACNVAADCKTCSMVATNCTSCLNSKYLDNGACVSTCSTYYDTINMQCVTSCPKYLVLQSSNCVSCTTGFQYLGSCVSNCSLIVSSNTFYSDETNRACIQCSSSCSTCDGPYPENCTSCKSGSTNPYLLLKMCWQFCPRGFYANPVTGKCQICPVQLNCQSCKYSSTSSVFALCTYCAYGYYFQYSNDSCSTTCSTNQYKNPWNNSCSNCDADCATCNGPLASSCLSCTGSDLILSNNTGGYCLTACPTVGYAAVSNTSCLPCDATCLTCNGTNPNQCLTCQTDLYLYNGYCRYVCPSTTYPDSTQQKCLGCHTSCTYCFDATAQGCTACSGTKYLYNFTCATSCPSGMTQNQWNICYEEAVKMAFLALCLICFMII